MEATVVKKSGIYLVGMSFYGDPFARASAWDEDNEIGALWKRFGSYCAAEPSAFAAPADDGKAGYELHIRHEETAKTGRYEVFVGLAVRSLAVVPVRLSAKILAPAEYAVITVRGDETDGDWMRKMFEEVVPGLGRAVDEKAGFSFERYDERFKGMDALAESEFEYYIPLSPRAGS